MPATIVAKAKNEDDGNPNSIAATATLEADRVYYAIVENSAAGASLVVPTCDSPNEDWVEIGSISFAGNTRFTAFRSQASAQRVSEVVTASFSATQTGASIILVEATSVALGGNGGNSIRSGSFSSATPANNTTGSLTLATGALAQADNRMVACFLVHANEAQDDPPDSGDSVRVDGDFHANPVRSMCVYTDDDQTADASWTSSVAFGAIGWEVVAASADQVLDVSVDSADGNWTDDAGGTDLSGNLTSETDTDYIQSDFGPSASASRVKLEAGGDPQASSGHKIRWRPGKDVTGTPNINMNVRLYQGGGNSIGAGTLIASFDRNNVDAFTTHEETLSGAEADSITDYSDLYLEFRATQV